MECESIEAFVASGHIGNFGVLLSAETVALSKWLHMKLGSFQDFCAGCLSPSAIKKDHMTQTPSAYAAQVKVCEHHCSDSSMMCQRQTGQVS